MIGTSQRKRFILAYTVVLILLIVLGNSFGKTRGFVYGQDASGAPLYTIDLLSSGSNDNLAIQFSAAVFAIPLFIRVLRFRKKMTLWEAIIFGAVWLVQGWLAMWIDAGSALKTIALGNNFVLLAWILLFVLILPIFGVVAQLSANEDRPPIP